MRNLYIWFETAAEREDFVKELLEIPKFEPRNGTKKMTKKQLKLKEEAEDYLAMLAAGKTKSPWFNLYKDYYFARIPEHEKGFTEPWHGPVVFTKGFRQIYAQNSYAHRPGKWLVIQFRNTKEAMKRYDWIMGRIPQEHLGTNVPLPESYFAKRRLEWAERVLAQKGPIKLAVLKKVYTKLQWVKEKAPKLFAGEKVFLWEELAFAFNYYGQLRQAEQCLRAQADLEPSQSDAFLNLGVFLTDGGLYGEALKAYREGLKRTPDCEFLNYNLAVLAEFLGNNSLARSALNEAILANPSRGLNIFNKGESHLRQKQYEVAAKYFKEALELSSGEEWAGLRLDCLKNLGFAYFKLAKFEEAVEILAEVVAEDPRCGASHRYLAHCYKALEEEWLAQWHLREARHLGE